MAPRLSQESALRLPLDDELDGGRAGELFGPSSGAVGGD
jgi:hypothetical protein